MVLLSLFLLGGEEGPFEELLAYFDVVLIVCLRGVGVVKVEQKFISFSGQESDDLAVVHHSNDGAILEGSFDGTVLVCCEVAEVLDGHLFVNAVRVTCH